MVFSNTCKIIKFQYCIFQDFKVLIENCVLYIIGKCDDGSSLNSGANAIQKKRHSNAIEGRNKLLKTEKTSKNGNYINRVLFC